jgi:hypothetical protein
MGTVSYQWKRGSTNVSTGTTYDLTQADAGAQISVVASYTDAQGTAESLSSAQTLIAAPSVSINGTTTEDQTLSVSTNLQGNLDYQWKRGGAAISGATSSTYVLVQDDVGSAITVTVGTDIANVNDITSAPTGNVANVNDDPTGSVTISGTPSVSQTLTANNNLADEDGLGSFSYQWKRNNVAISGATSQTYEVIDIDAGTNITVTISYTDAQNTAESKTSALVNILNPVVSISGVAQENQTLSLDLDNFSADSYQWKRNTVNISGATSDTYELVQDDVGKTITCTVSNNNVNIADKTTSASATAQNVNDPAVGKPTISGSLFVSNQLTVDTSPISDEDGINTSTFTYQWKKNGVAISGATASTYDLVSADNGTAITVSVSYDDNFNNSHTVDSLASTIADYSISISGTARENYSLTASANNLAGTVTYQWVRSSDSTVVSNSATYELVAADIGSIITVTVSNGVSGVDAKSQASATVQAENEATGSITVSTSGTGKFLVGETYQIDTSNISDADGGPLSFTYSTVFQRYDISTLQWVTAQDNGSDIEETTASFTLASKHNNLRPLTTVTSEDSRGGETDHEVYGKIIVTDPGSVFSDITTAEDVSPSDEDLTIFTDLLNSVGNNSKLIVTATSNNTNLIAFNGNAVKILYNYTTNVTSDLMLFDPEVVADANGQTTITVSFSVDDLVRFTQTVSVTVLSQDDDDQNGIAASGTYDSTGNGTITINFNSSNMIDAVSTYFYQLVHIDGASETQLFSDTNNIRSTGGTTQSISIDLGTDSDKTDIIQAIGDVQNSSGTQTIEVRVVAQDEHNYYVGSYQDNAVLDAINAFDNTSGNTGTNLYYSDSIPV